MLAQLLKKIGSLPLTIESWFLSATGIIIIRIFLEHYSSNEVGRFVLIDASTIVHYIVFFFATLLLSTLVLMFFSRLPLKESSVIALFGFMIIWLPPVVDLIISRGDGYIMHYLFLQTHDLARAFITLFWSTDTSGITYGIRIEIVIVIVAIFSAVYSSTKSFARALSAAFLFYLGIFILVSLPSFFGILQDRSIPRFVESSILNSRIMNNSTYPEQFGYERALDIGFNSLMTQVNLIIVLLLGSLVCLVGYREKLKVLLSNSRFERILHYSLLIVVGTVFGGGPDFFGSWINISSLLMTVVAFVFAWLVAVCINDIYDKEIDDISNKNRPLPQGAFSNTEFYSLSVVFFTISLVAAYSSSMYGLFFVITFSFAYYIYSAEPLRLKKHWIPGALVIGFACATALLAGFFLSAPDKSLVSFPPLFVLVIVVLFGFSSMIRDIKDYDGDKAKGISTLPVLLGPTKSKIIIGSVITLGFLVTAYFFRDRLLALAAIFSSIFVWKIFFAKVYKEKNFFIVYLSFLIIFIAVILSH